MASWLYLRNDLFRQRSVLGEHAPYCVLAAAFTKRPEQGQRQKPLKNHFTKARRVVQASLFIASSQTQRWNLQPPPMRVTVRRQTF